MIQSCFSLGVVINSGDKKEKSDLLKDLTFVITGSFNSFSRRDIKRLIQENGGRVTGSISKKTSFLISGENPGSKLSKANDNNIEIIDEKTLIQMINEN